MAERSLWLGGKAKGVAALKWWGSRADSGRAREPDAWTRRSVGPTVQHEAAAQMLGVTPGVLAAWTTRFGFPRPLVDHGDALYSRSELLVLRDALSSEHSVASAMVHAQDAPRCRRDEP
jgi:hypothetical protein